MSWPAWFDNVSSDAVFGLLGVLVGALLTTGKDVWAHFAGQKRVARYLAIRVVCVLDQYIENCAEVVFDDGLTFGQRDQNGYLIPQVALPSAPEFSEDLDWKSIDHTLAYEILSLPNEVASAEGAVAFAWENANPPDFEEAFEERALRYATIGLKAASIATRLRSEFGLPNQKLGDWKPIERMAQKKSEIEKRNEEYAAAHAKWSAQGGGR